MLLRSFWTAPIHPSSWGLILVLLSVSFCCNLLLCKIQNMLFLLICYWFFETFIIHYIRICQSHCLLWNISCQSHCNSLHLLMCCFMFLFYFCWYFSTLWHLLYISEGIRALVWQWCIVDICEFCWRGSH